MAVLEHVGRDVYLRHTDKDGNQHVQMHRAWDAEKFVQSQADAARKVGGMVQQLTEAQFRAERKK